MPSFRQPAWGSVFLLMALAAALLLFKVEKEGAPRGVGESSTEAGLSLRARPEAPSQTLAPAARGRSSAPGVIRSLSTGAPRGIFAPLAPGIEARGGSHPAGPDILSPAQASWAVRASAAGAREIIEGRVLSPEGVPVVGASITLGSASCLSSVDGRFALPRAAGRLRITHQDCFPREVEADGLPSAPLESVESPSHVASLSIVLLAGARIGGTVRDAAGRVVEGAEVRFGLGEAPPAARTRQDGSYESPLLRPEPVDVHISHPDHQPRVTRVPLWTPGAREKLDLRLVPGDRLVVRVRSVAGEPLPDAEVWLSPGETTRASIAPEGKGTEGAAKVSAVEQFLGRTGDLGLLETRREPGRAARARVRIPGFEEATAELPARPGDHEIVLKLHPAAAARGHAIDADTGLPVEVSGLRLERLEGPDFIETPDRGHIFRTLLPGKFVLGLPALEGTYRVAVTGRDSRSGDEELRGVSAPFLHDGRISPEPFIVRLEVRLELDGHASGPDGPLAGIRIELLHAPVPWPPVEDPADDLPAWRGERFEAVGGVRVPSPARVARSAVTDAAGRFTLTDLKPGNYRLRAGPPGLASYVSATLQVPWKGDYPIAVKRASTLRGRLLGPDGLPEVNRAVVLARGDVYAAPAWTDTDGHFELTGIAPGEGYRLLVGRREGSRDPLPPGADGAFLERALSFEEGKDVAYDLELRGAPSRGETGAPDTHAAAPLPESPPAGTGEGPRGEPGARPERPGALCHYRVDLVDRRTGTPFAWEAEVELESSSTGKTWQGRASAGSFEADRLPPGRYAVRVRLQGTLHHEANVEITRDHSHSIVIEEGIEVSVQVLAPGDEPFRGKAEVILLDGSREIYRSVELVEEVVTLRAPRPGTYELLVRSGTRRARSVLEVSR